MTRGAWWVAAVGVFCLSSPTLAEDRVTARLVTDVASVEPGEPFRIGVLYQIRPQWHIYWRWPGNSGVPTRVEFQLPDGFEVGPLRWPVPKRFVQPGQIRGYGYENKVLLTARVVPPEDLPTGTTATLKAETDWLVCREVCKPGKASLRSQLPVEKEARPANRTLFRRWERRLPSPPFADENERLRQDVQVRTDGGKGPWVRYTIVVPWAGTPADVHWVPALDAALSVRKQQVQTSDGRTTVRFEGRVKKGLTASIDRMPTLVMYQKEDDRGAVRVPIPVPGKT